MINTSLDDIGPKKITFRPDISWYHSVLLKTYGRDKSLKILGIVKPRNTGGQLRICKMCRVSFRTRSTRKVYCGRMEEPGTCSYKYRQQRQVGYQLDRKLREAYRRMNEQRAEEAV